MNTPKRGNNNHHRFVAIEGEESMEVVSLRSKRRVGGRHGSPTPTTTTLQRHPYRIHFSITEKSARSWMRAPRRSIKWVFGLAHRQGESWKVEEQQVILTWNTKSGKIKSVNWNKHEILHLVRFRLNNIESNLLECSWRLRTGELLQLQVRPDVTSERERYTLNLDGESFASFPTIRQLERDERQYYEAPEPSLPFEELLQDHVGADKRPLAAGSLDGSATASDPLSDPPSLSSEQEIRYRLSMAGFNHQQKNTNIAFTCGADDDLLLQDELHSDLYSPQLDALRHTITEALPSAEPIISRAIAHAFCAETGSMTSSCDSLSVYSLEGGCPSALEASVLKGALEWTRRTAATSPEEVDDERRLHFLQKLIDELLMHFRNENIDADETAKIVLNAAVVLGLGLEHEIPKDTVLVCDRLHNNNKNGLSEHDMIHRLQQLYGDIRTAAIAPFSGIGFARFVHSADAQRAAASSAEQSDTNDDDLHLLLVAPATDFSARKFMFGSDTPKRAARGVAAFHRRRHSSSTTLDSTDHTTTSAGSDDTTP